MNSSHEINISNLITLVCKEVETPKIVPVDNPSGPKRTPKWNSDSACSTGGRPSCAKWHPGAYGCLRSTDSDNIGGAGDRVEYILHFLRFANWQTDWHLPLPCPPWVNPPLSLIYKKIV